MTKPPTNPSLVIVGRPTIVKSTLFTNLSDFKRLTELVAAETGERIRDTELEDRFLGRLHLNGVEVHTRAAEILSRAIPTPTESSTNFDLLFETELYQYSLCLFWRQIRCAAG